MLALLLAALPAFAGNPPGAVLDPAVAVDVTPEGLAAIEPIAATFVPETLPLDPIADADQADRACINLIFDEICWVPWSYFFEVSGFDVTLALDELSIVPDTDALVLDITILASIASAGDPGSLDFGAEIANVDLFGLEFTVLDIDEACDVWLEPTPLSASTTITLDIDFDGPDGPELVFDIAPLDLDLEVDGLEIEGCIIDLLDEFVEAVNGFLGVFNFDIGQILTGLVAPILDGFVDDLLVDLEAQIAPLLGSLRFDTELDLLGVVLDVLVEPSALDITPDGIRIALAGAIAGTGNPAPCVSAYGIDESLATGTGLPAIRTPGPLEAHHVAVLADDDLANQALFALWYEGLLCQTVDPAALGALLPIPLDGLLGILAGDTFEDLLPEGSPVVLATTPRLPPIVSAVEGGVQIDLEELGLDLYSELDGRLTRLVGLDVAATVPVGLAFAPDTGALAIDIDLGADSFALTPTYSELVPDADQAVADGLGGLLNTVVGGLLPSLLGDLSFALPALSGLGVQDLVIAPAGSADDIIGVFGLIGLVDYAGEGDLGGCADGGDCGGGCNQGAAPWWLAGIALVALRRRRRAPRGD